MRMRVARILSRIALPAALSSSTDAKLTVAESAGWTPFGFCVAGL